MKSETLGAPASKCHPKAPFAFFPLPSFLWKSSFLGLEISEGTEFPQYLLKYKAADRIDLANAMMEMMKPEFTCTQNHELSLGKRP